MIQILKKLAQMNLVNVYATNDGNKLLKWGENFQSRISPRLDLSEDNGYFIINFKKTIVHINSYKMKSLKDYLFPKKWNLFVSNDNTTWEPISSNVVPLCQEKDIYQVPNDDKFYCSEADEFSFRTNHTGFHYFVKFVMLENSYYANNRWDDDITLSGFSLLGSYTFDHNNQLSCRNNRNNGICMLFLISLVCS